MWAPGSFTPSRGENKVFALKSTRSSTGIWNQTAAHITLPQTAHSFVIAHLNVTRLHATSSSVFATYKFETHQQIVEQRSSGLHRTPNPTCPTWVNLQPIDRVDWVENWTMQEQADSSIRQHTTLPTESAAWYCYLSVQWPAVRGASEHLATWKEHRKALLVCLHPMSCFSLQRTTIKVFRKWWGVSKIS